jgi:hypothetical protein
MARKGGQGLFGTRIQMDEDITGVERDAIHVVNQYIIESIYVLIQLSCRFTPPSASAAFEQLHRYLMSEPPRQVSFELERVNFDSQLADHGEELIDEPESRTNGRRE